MSEHVSGPYTGQLMSVSFGEVPGQECEKCVDDGYDYLVARLNRSRVGYRAGRVIVSFGSDLPEGGR